MNKQEALHIIAFSDPHVEAQPEEAEPGYVSPSIFGDILSTVASKAVKACIIIPGDLVKYGSEANIDLVEEKLSLIPKNAQLYIGLGNRDVQKEWLKKTGRHVDLTRIFSEHDPKALLTRMTQATGAISYEDGVHYLDGYGTIGLIGFNGFIGVNKEKELVRSRIEGTSTSAERRRLWIEDATPLYVEPFKKKLDMLGKNPRLQYLFVATHFPLFAGKTSEGDDVLRDMPPEIPDMLLWFARKHPHIQQIVNLHGHWHYKTGENYPKEEDRITYVDKRGDKKEIIIRNVALFGRMERQMEAGREYPVTEFTYTLQRTGPNNSEMHLTPVGGKRTRQVLEAVSA